MVGCVIVQDEQIIAEGWHQRYGEAHAELDAVNQLEDTGQLLGCTVYVTLEPCSHYGKNPACADLLAEHRVGRVVISSRDPNPLVDGQGIARLQEAGIQRRNRVARRGSSNFERCFFLSVSRSESVREVPTFVAIKARLNVTLPGHTFFCYAPS